MDTSNLPDLDQIADASEDLARTTKAAGSILRRVLNVGERLFRGHKTGAELSAAPDDRDEPADAESIPPRTVVLFGPGGVGKTTFGRFVRSGSAFPAEPPGNCVEDLNVERFRAPTGGAEAEYVVPPGQEHRRPRDWDDLLARLSRGEFCGVIIFASYGYHSLAQAGGYKSHHLYDGSRPRFLPAYLKAKRDEEVEVATVVGRAVRHSPEPIWVLTCVTKQDLWWKDQADVNKFYENGAFAEALDSALEGCDQSSLRRESSFCCLAIQNLRDAHREILAEQDSKYDEIKKAESIKALLDRLETLMGEIEG